MYQVLRMAHGLRSCSSRAYLLCSTWHLSSPTRVRTISPELKGGFLMTGPPGKSRGWLCTCLRKKENHLRMFTWTVAGGGAGEGFSSVQSLSRVWLFETPQTAACQASLSITNSRSLLKTCPLSWWCHPTISSSAMSFSSCLQSFPASGCFPRSQFFTSGGQSIGVSASLSVRPMNIQDWSLLGWIWLDLLAVQGTRKSLLQHHISKASILRCPVFFIVQLSHPYTTTGKTITLTRWAFVGKVISLLFIMLSRLVITFLPRSKHLLILWLQAPSTVILEPKKIVCHCFHCFPIYLPWSDGTECHDLSFLNVEL